MIPKASRVDSSNYDPQPGWSSGNQLVSLNYQTKDRPLHINIGKFKENGNCGFLLKPPYMRNSESSDRMSAVRLTVHVISGQQLPKPGGVLKGDVVDPYIVVHVNGTGADTKEYRTKTINDNGFNPVWDEVLYLFVFFYILHLVR